MSEKASEPNAASPRDESPSAREPLEHLTYEGTRVPRFVIVVWLAFFVWGLVYLLSYVPASVREWFLGK